LWRELEKRMSKDIALDGVDPLHVIEWAMRYFFGLAQTVYLLAGRRRYLTLRTATKVSSVSCSGMTPHLGTAFRSRSGTDWHAIAHIG
jgi:hypothetical protein